VGEGTVCYERSMSQRTIAMTALLVAASGCPGDDADETTQAGTQMESTGGSSESGEPTSGTSETGESSTSGETSTGSTTGTTGEPGESVVVERVDRHFLPSGDVIEVPRDPAADVDALQIAAIVDSVVQLFDGEFDGAGKRTYSGLPAGPYVLREEVEYDDLPGDESLVEFREFAAPLLDHGSDRSGRPDVAVAVSGGTQLSLTVTDMTELGPFDYFEAYSVEADTLSFLVSGYYPDVPDPGTHEPAPGDTALDAWTVSWNDAYTSTSGGPLVDPRQGDTLVLNHIGSALAVEDPTVDQLTDPWTYAFHERLLESAPLTLETMQDGATNLADGAFVPVQAKLLDLDFGVSTFLAELDPDVDDINFLGCGVYVYLEPGVETPLVGVVPALGSVSVARYDVPVDPACFPDEMDGCDANACPDGCDPATTPALPDDRAVSVAYGNPFAHGTEVLSISCSRSVSVQHPVQGTSDSILTTVATSVRVADAGVEQIATLGAPQDLEIDGRPVAIDAVVEGVGATPTLTFSAPAIGAADFYRVTIRATDDVSDADDNVVSARRTVAQIYTLGTSVTVPEGVLKAGSYYHFVVNAYQGLPYPATGRFESFETASASASTGLVTP
jgi:hypothetical protein